MSHRFIHCGGRTRLTDEQVASLRALDPDHHVVEDLGITLWCELSAGHEGVAHHAMGVAVVEGDEWWVQWNASGDNELVALPLCEVNSRDPRDTDSEVCGLFEGHPGRHDWAEQDPAKCEHGGAGTPRLISEAVAYDGRYVTVFEAQCQGCPERMVQVVLTNPKQARPPQHLGARASVWAFFGPES